MTDVPKYLAKDLDVCLLEQVIELIRDTRQWGVRTQSGNLYTAKHLVITAPLPQALALLDTSGLNYAGANLAALRAVRYDKGLATLAILDGPSSLPEHGGVSIADGPIRWIADNQKKGISENVSAVTIHASAEFAAEHWDSSNDVRGQLMLDAAAPHLGAKVVDYDCHRWGYGFPINPMPELCYFSWGLSLVLAGDAFGGPRVEGSALSGLAAARELMECSSLA
jgi:predicted NAD/FAD-dependent oxidoreductase